MNHIPKIIKQTTGQGPMEFVQNVLGINYQTFCYRLKTGVLRLEHIHKIIHATGKTFEELFPNPYGAPKYLQSVTIPTLPPPAARKERPPIAKEKKPFKAKAVEEDIVFTPVLPPVNTPPPVRQKEEPVEDMPFIDLDDVYNNGAEDVSEQSGTEDPKIAWKPVVPPKKK
jgi:hypothetical protein